MKRTVSRFQSGKPLLEQLSAERLNDILDLIESKGVAFGNNITGTRTPGGTIIRAKSGGAPGAIVPSAFDVLPASDDVSFFKVKVVDGRVNGDFPSGMGFDNYVLTIVEESFQEVYVIVTYDTSTLNITSLSLARNDVVPANSSGTLIIPIADIQITYDGGGSPIMTITQLLSGNIDFSFVYGSFNGAPSLLAVRAFGDWIPV